MLTGASAVYFGLWAWELVEWRRHGYSSCIKLVLLSHVLGGLLVIGSNIVLFLVLWLIGASDTFRETIDPALYGWGMAMYSWIMCLFLKYKALERLRRA